MMDMGHFPSKGIDDCLGTVDVSSHASKETPVRIRVLDPRSPSEGIPRTPIEVPITREEIISSQPSDILLLEETNFETSMGVHNGNKTEDFVLLCDPRSPSAEISRTPIEATGGAQTKQPDRVLLETDLDAEFNKINFSTYRSGNKPLDIKNKIFDKNFCITKDKRAVIDENSSELEKENEMSLKRKLFLTPESSPVMQAALKVRNPLGSMSNYQQSPSLLLKMKQSWKIEQSARAVIYDLENTPNSRQPSRSEKQTKGQQVVDWDKDSTMII